MLRQRHVVRLETRPANIEGKGAVRQRELVINALRMRPDRIIVGEVRGEEALDMLQAMNTGHDGSLTTIHANTPRDALYRLDTMVAMANLNIPDKAIRQQIASAIDLIVQISRQADGTRKVTAITEITGMEGEVITMQDIFLFEKTGISAGGQGHAAGSAPPASGRSAAIGWRRRACSCRWTCSSTCRWWRSERRMMLPVRSSSRSSLVLASSSASTGCSCSGPKTAEQSALSKRLKAAARPPASRTLGCIAAERSAAQRGSAPRRGCSQRLGSVHRPAPAADRLRSGVQLTVGALLLHRACAAAWLATLLVEIAAGCTLARARRRRAARLHPVLRACGSWRSGARGSSKSSSPKPST